MNDDEVWKDNTESVESSGNCRYCGKPEAQLVRLATGDFNGETFYVHRLCAELKDLW